MVVRIQEIERISKRITPLLNDHCAPLIHLIHERDQICNEQSRRTLHPQPDANSICLSVWSLLFGPDIQCLQYQWSR